MPGPTSCRVAKTNTKIPEESNSSGQADGLLPVIESNEAALVLASYGRRYRLAAASLSHSLSGITLFIFVN